MGYPKLVGHSKEENWEVAKFENQHYTIYKFFFNKKTNRYEKQHIYCNKSELIVLKRLLRKVKPIFTRRVQRTPATTSRPPARTQAQPIRNQVQTRPRHVLKPETVARVAQILEEEKTKRREAEARQNRR